MQDVSSPLARATFSLQATADRLPPFVIFICAPAPRGSPPPKRVPGQLAGPCGTVVAGPSRCCCGASGPGLRHRPGKKSAAEPSLCFAPLFFCLDTAPDTMSYDRNKAKNPQTAPGQNPTTELTQNPAPWRTPFKPHGPRHEPPSLTPHRPQRGSY